MTVNIRNAKGEVIRTSQNLRAVLEYARQHSYVILRQEGRTLHVRFGTGENCDTCVTEFPDPDVLNRWIASRVYLSKNKTRGQFITWDKFLRMEAARLRGDY